MITHRIGLSVARQCWIVLLLAMGCLIPAIAWSGGPYDGQYAGTRTSDTGDDGSTCAKTGPYSLVVADNAFEFTYLRQRNVVLRPAIAPDGTFSARQEYMLQKASTSARITGRIVGDSLTADVEGQRCHYRLDLKKR